MKRLVILFSIAVFVASCNHNLSDERKSQVQKEELTLEEHAKKIKIRVIDTDFSKGRLTNQQLLTLWDVQKMHGHLCDGLVVGFLGLREGLYQLYPDSLIDRTNTHIVAKSSPCIGDVGLYLSGGRYQFNSFYVDNSISGIYVVQRIDNNKAVVIRMKKGVKPGEIDILGAKAIKQELDACSLDSLKVLEDNFSQKLFNGTPEDFFEIEILEDFEWNPILLNDFTKTDILNKSAEKCD